MPTKPDIRILNRILRCLSGKAHFCHHNNKIAVSANLLKLHRDGGGEEGWSDFACKGEDIHEFSLYLSKP